MSDEIPGESFEIISGGIKGLLESIHIWFSGWISVWATERNHAWICGDIPEEIFENISSRIANETHREIYEGIPAMFLKKPQEEFPKSKDPRKISKKYKGRNFWRNLYRKFANFSLFNS